MSKRTAVLGGDEADAADADGGAAGGNLTDSTVAEADDATCIIADISLPYASGGVSLEIRDARVDTPCVIGSTRRVDGELVIAPDGVPFPITLEVDATLPIIGVGGIGSGADAYAKIRAGADAVQLYSALVYEGPGLVRRIKRELAARLRADGFVNVGEARG